MTGASKEAMMEGGAASMGSGSCGPRAGEEPSTREELRFCVLGPVRVRRGSEPLATGSPQQRALLATLLLQDGRTVPTTELLDALWGVDLPLQALAALRTYVSRLRKALGPGLLFSESGGYAIRLPNGPGALDLSEARGLATDAEKAKGSGRLAQARALYDRALTLWDGEPLAGVPGPYADMQRARLAEWHMQLLESRLTVDLELGVHDKTVSELTPLTAAHPLRERLRELLMLALYRSGRQAEALAVFADTRRLLAEELGVDPSAGLRDLQHRILRADPALLVRAAQGPGLAPAPAAAPRPAQLPASISDFTGRADLVDALTEHLTGAPRRAMAIGAVAGLAGVGKTALAVHAAQAARRHFPDGQLHADLRGATSQPADPARVLGDFLHALGTPGDRIPDSLETRAALYRSTLDGRRVLVLLDNARDAAQVRPLLPGSPGCAVLVTSRVRMVDLAGTHLLDVDVMPAEEALQLFTRIVGESRVAGEREAALEVVAACGFLPLALRIAASRLAARRTWTVGLLAARLADERRRLDELRAGDLEVTAVFEWSYAQLDTAQARAYRLLSLVDGPDISLAAAAHLLDLPVQRTEELLEHLVDASLLEGSAPERYRYHDLLRLFARACAARDTSEAAEHACAVLRLLDFYLATAAGAYAHERPGDRMVDHLEPTCRAGLDFAELQQARDWLFVEVECVLSAVELASSLAGAPGCPTQQHGAPGCLAEQPGSAGPREPGTLHQAPAGGLLRKAVDVLLTLRDRTDSGNHVARQRAAALALRDAAIAAGDARSEVRARAIIARLRMFGGRLQQAEEEARQAVLRCDFRDDPWIAGHVLVIQGVIALYAHRFEDGEAYLLRAVEQFRASDDAAGVAGALSSLSRIHVSMGRPERAIGLAEQALKTYDHLGHVLPGAHARYALALALPRVGAPDKALPLLAEARQVFRDSHQRHAESTASVRIAEAYLDLRLPARAAEAAEAALPLETEPGDEGRRALVLTVLGRALTQLGHSLRAAACFREALSLYEGRGDGLGAREAENVRGLLRELPGEGISPDTAGGDNGKG